MLKTIWFLFYTELILLIRRSQEWLYPLTFFMIIISLFPFAFTPDPLFLKKWIPGCVWIAALFASLLSIETIFLAEIEEGHLEQLLLSTIPLPFLMLIKLCAQWIMTMLPILLIIPLVGLLFHLASFTIFVLTLSLLFGTPCLTLIGSLSVALTLGLRQQGIILSVLILPLVTPILIFGVSSSQQEETGIAISGPLFFLAGLSLLAITFLPWVIAETLRLSLED